VTRREGILGQRVEADVELALRAVAGARPDRLSAVVDYEAVERFVRSRIERSRRRLLETLAEDLARSLLREFRVPSVRIRLRKLHVPVSGFSGTPEVWIERSRA
jgi:dihydroneopterin aldolase